ncbi:hypothetical protein AGMMS49921_01310 [Endomicrobiia bacterium]|nr:hypothetical protein AGMMS49921_01310 [Endomicrobiia bacterium]
MILKENTKLDSLSITEKGGLYYGFEVGYEFFDDSAALTLGVTYSHYTSSILRSESVLQQSFGKLVYGMFNELFKINCGIVGITIGFKFKI